MINGNWRDAADLYNESAFSVKDFLDMYEEKDFLDMYEENEQDEKVIFLEKLVYLVELAGERK